MQPIQYDGIHVAQIAGLAPEVVARAKDLMKTLEVQTTKPQAGPESSKVQVNAPQMSLFTEYIDHPAMEKLRKADLNRLTPIEAFDFLRKLKEDLKR